MLARMRLEFVEGTSKKFWEAEVSGKTLITRWGRIGTRGQEKKQVLGSPAKAEAAATKAIADKKHKGYRDIAARAPAPPSTNPRNAALEAAIRADRDEYGPYQVYADWLQEQGDPLGELIVLQHGKKTKPAAKIIDKLGLPGDQLATFGWRWGLWQWVRLENSVDWMDAKFDPVGLARSLFVTPMCAALEELRIGILRWDFNQDDVPAVLAEAGKHAWAKDLQRLHLGDVADDIDMAHHVIGSIGAISKLFPRLRWLKLHSGEQDWRAKHTFELGKLDLPELTELVIETCSMSKPRLKQVLAAKLPKLERLELWFGSSDQGGANCTLKDVMPILDGKLFPALRHLALRNAEFADGLARAVPVSPIAARLASLDLSMGTMTDAGAEALAVQAKRLAKLATLAVDDNFLTAAGTRALSAAFGKRVTAKDQKDPDDSIEGEIHYYVSVAE